MKLSARGVVLKYDGAVSTNLQEDIALPRIPNGQRQFTVIDNNTGYNNLKYQQKWWQ